jgi:hypothetical protein
MVYSRGVPCAIRYCSEHPQKLRGLMVGDCPARLTRPTREWGERVRRSLPVDPDYSHVIDALIDESQDTELWNDLECLGFPVLVLRGMQQGALLSDQHSSLYRAHLPQVEVIEMHESGHELWKPDYDAFVRIIETFLREVDGMRAMPADGSPEQRSLRPGSQTAELAAVPLSAVDLLGHQSVEYLGDFALNQGQKRGAQ